MRLAVVLFVVACGGSPASNVANPTLEPDPPAVMPPTPTSFDTEFAAPVSNPSGAPIKVAAFVPAPGLRRTRTLDTLFTVDQDLGEGQVFQQRTTKRFLLREAILAAVDTTITKLEVTADMAEERTELRGAPDQLQLLVGTYLVTPDSRDTERRRLHVTRLAGMDVGSREVEELSYLFLQEVGEPYGPNAVIATKALRLGEAIELHDDDLRRLGADSDVTLSLIAVDGDIATFQFFSTASTPYVFDQHATEHIGTKAALGVEISTGRVVRSELTNLRLVENKLIKRSTRTMKLEYAR